MAKLPIFSTAFGAIWFGFRHLLTNIRMGWLPIVAILVIVFGFMYFTVGMSLGELVASDGDEEVATQIILQMAETFTDYKLIFGFAAVGYLVFSIYMAPVLRVAGLDEKAPSGFANFTINGAVIATFISFVVYEAIVEMLSKLPMVGAGYAQGLDWKQIIFPEIDPEALAAMIQSSEPESWESMMGLNVMGLEMTPLLIGAMVLTVLLSIIFAVRLSPMIAVGACEGKLSILGTWNMTKGNFWRIVFTYILYFLLLIGVIIGFAVGAAVAMGGSLGAMSAVGVEGIGLALGGIGSALMIFVLGIVSVFYFMGTSIGLTGLIYKSLKDNK